MLTSLLLVKWLQIPSSISSTVRATTKRGIGCRKSLCTTCGDTSQSKTLKISPPSKRSSPLVIRSSERVHLAVQRHPLGVVRHPQQSKAPNKNTRLDRNFIATGANVWRGSPYLSLLQLPEDLQGLDQTVQEAAVPTCPSDKTPTAALITRLDFAGHCVSAYPQAKMEVSGMETMGWTDEKLKRRQCARARL